MRPSLRSDSDISVSFDWNSSLAGMQVGWICVKQGLANSAPRRRIEVRAGEVSKGVTVRSPQLQQLARDLCEALPGALGTITVQAFLDGAPDDPAATVAVIEINARYGGGFPLALEAGADFPRWQLEELLGLPSTATADGWRPGLVILRYDAAVFVDEAEAPS